jgi:hypothetical protein
VEVRALCPVFACLISQQRQTQRLACFFLVCSAFESQRCEQLGLPLKKSKKECTNLVLYIPDTNLETADHETPKNETGTPLSPSAQRSPAFVRAMLWHQTRREVT